MNTKSQDVNALRARLANAEGREFWRSLDELADTPEFNELLSVSSRTAPLNGATR